MGSHARGFTIIEVILFLAISGLLLTGALVGINANISNARFNDAINSTTSFLQRQYDEVAAGRNDRSDNLTCDASLAITNGDAMANPAQHPGMTNCAILGRYLKFQGSDFTSRYIIGYWDKITDLPVESDTAALSSDKVQLAIAPATVFEATYEVPWRISIKRTTPSSLPPALGLAIIRSPISGNIIYYSFPSESPAPPLTNGDDHARTNLINPNNLNQAVDLCFADEANQRSGHIKIVPGQGQEVIQTDLSDAVGDCS